ncbi:MAG: hypothetical protein GKS02_14220 [Alphaproteobacteria bacterium]|nr:hypothetical protein [Alphaproteobacteria bacterium]
MVSVSSFRTNPKGYVDERLGRIVFGNSTTFSRNLEGRLTMARARVASRGHGDLDTSIDSSLIRTQGFAIAPKLFPVELIQTIEDKFSQMLAEGHPATEPRPIIDGVAYRFLLLDAGRYIPATAGLLDENVSNAVRGYFGSNFGVMTLKIWRNLGAEPDVAAQGIYANNWHCDAQPTSILKMMVNLSDVTEADGPFHVQSRKDTKRIIRAGYGTRENYAGAANIIDNPNAVVKCTGPKGSMVLCNTELCMHKAGTVEPGRTRDMLQIELIPSPEPLPTDWYRVQTLSSGN